jgi:hypothetical protein
MYVRKRWKLIRKRNKECPRCKRYLKVVGKAVQARAQKMAEDQPGTK